MSKKSPLQLSNVFVLWNFYFLIFLIVKRKLKKYFIRWYFLWYNFFSWSKNGSKIKKKYILIFFRNYFLLTKKKLIRKRSKNYTGLWIIFHSVLFLRLNLNLKYLFRLNYYFLLLWVCGLIHMTLTIPKCNIKSFNLQLPYTYF